MKNIEKSIAKDQGMEGFTIMKKAADATSEDARDLVLSHMFLKKMASENEEETKKYMDEAAELSSIEEES